MELLIFEVSTAVKMMFFFCVWRRADSSVDANVSEKHTVSIFRADILSICSGLKMGTVCFSETMASTDGSKRRQNPDEEHLDGA
jgi:hypothetical protein